MSEYSAEYTNFLPLFNDLELDPETDMLWLMYHDTATLLEDLQKKSIWNNRKNIFLIDCENSLLVDQLQWANDTRVHIWTPCVSNLNRSDLYHFWFDWVQEIEKFSNYTKQLRLQTSKNYFFDALLGTNREHKNIIYSLIEKSENKDNFLTSYIGSPQPNWIRGCDDENENLDIIYNNVQVASASVTIPYKIYNQCWYSLVAETSAESPNFYTEKTVKPLLAKRLFVMFAAQHHLKYLKDFGFRTFEGIIDESYDDIANLETRYQHAWKQVEFLLQQDPIKIYKQAEPILEHNYNHFVSTNWKKEMHEKIQNISHSSK